MFIPMTVGSRSTITARGTCFPAPVSLKKVLKESSPPPTVLSEGIWPSGWIPCSRQYNSQQALPIWTPACPTWIEIHSRYREWKARETRVRGERENRTREEKSIISNTELAAPEQSRQHLVELMGNEKAPDWRGAEQNE